MSAIPTKRILVYVIAGTVVLVVGTLGVLSLRDGRTQAESGRGEVLAATGLSLGDASVVDVAGAEDPTAASSSTTTTAAPLIYVQVAGAVRRPGVYRLAPDARVFEAVAEAGGFTDEADQQALTLAARLTDGCRVYVPGVGETVAEPVAPAVDEGAGEGDGGAGGAGPGVVSLNSATLEQLDSLPGIGPAIAQDIITYRETNGPFTSVDQLLEVPGIGPARLERLRPLVGL
jgi:competence protein ComEA